MCIFGGEQEGDQEREKLGSSKLNKLWMSHITALSARRQMNYAALNEH